MARILIIDDDPTLLATLEALLTAAGHGVVTAGDGEEGAKRFRAQPFELIITDIIMPKREGIETIITLRHEFPAVRVIAMSGGHSTSQTCLTLAARLGAQQTLAKPFSPRQLYEAIAAVLGGPTFPPDRL